MRFVLLFVFYSSLFSSPLLAEEEIFHGFGAGFFIQGLNSELSIRDSDNRQVKLKPEPPSNNGVGLSYRGVGLSYSQTSNSDEDKLKRSDAKGFKWSIPWRFFLLEMEFAEYQGVLVNEEDFRDDVEARTVGGNVTWARDRDFDFSSIFGLERSLSQGNRPYVTKTYYTVGVSHDVWEGEESFWVDSQLADSILDFNFLRRNAIRGAIGRTYVKYFDLARLSAMGDVGLFWGDRKLSYTDKEDETDNEVGLSISFAVSMASDVGFRRLGKKWGVNFNYGISLQFRFIDSLDDFGIGLNNFNNQIYIGGLW